MRYQMRQRIFSLTDSFNIEDENGKVAYIVKGRFFSIGHKLSFQDPEGNELALIDQKLLSWGPTYNIYRGGELMATVHKKLFTLLHCRFTVDVPGPNDLDASGNLSDHEYTFEREGRPVATVSKAWFALSDRYGIEVAEGEDPVLILASAVVIDMVCHGDKHE
jgi:uncharacterized protein YxjI